MPRQPTNLRAHVYVDGQNLFYGVKEAFGYKYPNFDIKKLAEAVCTREGWQLAHTAFYTGVPEVSDNRFWNYFWRNKMAVMGRQGVKIYSRHLRYRLQTVRLPDGTEHSFVVGQEKGVDVRLALDIVRAVHRQECDVVVIFSQDQDLSEAADEARLIASEQNRTLAIASAFPSSPTAANARGINTTHWIRIDRATYDSCLDTRDYRPVKKT
jgi:uncharacterized LabA/DUF88 family protein